MGKSMCVMPRHVVKKMTNKMRYTAKQTGAGLIEILVALLILAIGVLGFIGMQVKALSSTSEAFNRAQATILASEIAAHMTLNSRRLVFISSETTLQAYEEEHAKREDILNRYLNGAQTADLQKCLGFSSDSGPKCDQLAIVDWDLLVSERDIQNLLPGGAFTITKTGTEVFTVEVGWASKEESNTHTESCETETTSCVRLEVIP